MAQGVKVDQCAVVGQGNDHVVDHGEVRLRGLPALGTRRAVAAVAAGHLARHGGEVRVGEDLRNQAQILADEDGLAVAHGDAGGVLAAVLQGPQAKVGDAGHVAAGCPDAKDAALLMELVVGLGSVLGGRGRRADVLLDVACHEARSSLGG